MKSPNDTARNRTLRRQGGAYAVEYALIFPVFFALLYGTILYGMIFTTRLSLQHASEEGARAVLRFQPGDNAAERLSCRIGEALRVACTQAAWMKGFGDPTARADVCLAGADCIVTPVATTSLTCPEASDPDEVPPLESPDCPTLAAAVCGETLTTSCQIVVTVTYPYAAKPLIPGLPGFGLLVPTTLQGRARTLLDGRAL